MPPRELSRHLFTDGLTLSSGKLSLSLRVPFRFQNLPDTRAHVVREGETLFTLAGRYFAPMERACGLWWVIADFQPAPIFDPTVMPTLGSIVYVPSVRTVVEKVLSEARRGEVVL